MSKDKLKAIEAKYSSLLDDKKEQTSYKIEYVSAYVKEWLYVFANRPQDTPSINFIDCMCNAGIYKDGELGTPMRVLELFREAAYQHPNRQFNVFLNDNDAKRIEIIKEVANEILGACPKNLSVFYACEDVNAYIGKVSYFNKQCKPFGCGTILFVDPYNFGAVKLQSLKAFLNEYYCELLYNIFTSDYVRRKTLKPRSDCIMA